MTRTAQATKTINPLHFEDLEPHRFEDLARQLIYDFKDWQLLEATGRSGSDDGFDARGVEPRIDNEVNEDESQEPVKKQEQRLWLVQCKRERKIGPSELRKYLKDITDAEKLYGIIFIAACDFSKKARDTFFAFIREKGISEAHLWGKAELEDKLFQPANDHLLFAYFGVSLVLRRRSIKTAVNSRLITKRKLVRLFDGLESQQYKTVLLRDINDTAYPYKENVPDFKERPSWVLRTFARFFHDGLVILVKEHFAYAVSDSQEWDFYEKHFDRGGFIREDPWNDVDEEKVRKQRQLLHDFWYYRIPEENRAWFRVYRFIPYERIVAVDELGDDWTNDMGQVCPHLYVEFQGSNGPFDEFQQFQIETIGHNATRFSPKKNKKIEYFPSKIPEVTQEERDKFLQDMQEKSRRT